MRENKAQSFTNKGHFSKLEGGLILTGRTAAGSRALRYKAATHGITSKESEATKSMVYLYRFSAAAMCRVCCKRHVTEHCGSRANAARLHGTARACASARHRWRLCTLLRNDIGRSEPTWRPCSWRLSSA
eukprot:3255885-Rhodomonas_salina.1